MVASRVTVATSAPTASTVQSASKPESTSTRRTGPIGIAGDASTAPITASSTPPRIAIAGAITDAAGDQVRVGTERPRRFLVLAPAAQMPCECLADEDESREPHDDAEHTECQRDRPCRLHRMEGVRRRHPKELRAACRVRGDRLLHRRDVRVPVAQHEALPRVELETLRLAHERGREQDERGSVGVVLRDLFDERTDADDRRVDEQAGLRVLQQCRIRVLDVVSAHDAEIDALTDVVAVPPSGFLVDDDFVRPRRVRQPPLDRCEAILVEVTPVDAADRLEVLGEIGSVTPPARDVERGVGASLLHLGQVRDRSRDSASPPASRPPTSTTIVEGLVERRKRGYADCVRRAPAIANIESPPVSPSSSAMPTSAGQRRRQDARVQYAENPTRPPRTHCNPCGRRGQGGGPATAWECHHPYEIMYAMLGR